jgi:hypothetical protein
MVGIVARIDHQQRAVEAQVHLEGLVGVRVIDERAAPGRGELAVNESPASNISDKLGTQIPAGMC